MGRCLNLHIPEPCSESWDAMRPEAAGRHCLSCQKTVTDFTHMTDAQLAAWFRNDAGNTCGRFYPDQLQRVLEVPRRPMPGLRAFFTITLPAFLLSLKASAQTAPPAVEVAPAAADAPVMGRMLQLPKRDSVVGTVSGEGYPVPFATVTLKGTKQAVACDANGMFKMDGVRFPCTLLVSSVGYKGTEVRVESADTTHIFLKRDETMALGGAVVVTYSKKPRKFRSLFKPKAAPAPLPPSISIYPNPVAAGSDLHIEGRNLEPGAYHIELYSLAGQLLRKGAASCNAKSDRMTLTTGGIAAGQYIVRVVNDKTGKVLSAQAVLQ